MTPDQIMSHIDALTDQLGVKTRAYARREEAVRAAHARGGQNFSGDIRTVLKNDVLLADLSGSAKTIAALLSAFTGAYLAKIEHEKREQQEDSFISHGYGSNS